MKFLVFQMTSQTLASALKAHTRENVIAVSNPHQFDPVEPRGPLQVPLIVREDLETDDELVWAGIVASRYAKKTRYLYYYVYFHTKSLESNLKSLLISYLLLSRTLSSSFKKY